MSPCCTPENPSYTSHRPLKPHALTPAKGFELFGPDLYFLTVLTALFRVGQLSITMSGGYQGGFD